MDTVFQPIGVARTGVLWRPRPQRDHRFIRFGQDQDGFEAYISRDVLAFVCEETRRFRPNETIGLLAGRACQDGRGPYSLICAAQGARPAEVEATPGHVHLSAVSAARVQHRLESAAPGLELVGWYHSHPHSPPVFSAEDRQNQAARENPHHIGLVVSGLPGLARFGVYRGPRAVVLRESPELSEERPWALPVSPEQPAPAFSPEPSGGAEHFTPSLPTKVFGGEAASGRAGVPTWTLLPLLLQAVVLPLILVALILWRWPLQPDASAMLTSPNAPEVTLSACSPGGHSASGTDSRHSLSGYDGEEASHHED